MLGNFYFRVSEVYSGITLNVFPCNFSENLFQISLKIILLFFSKISWIFWETTPVIPAEIHSTISFRSCDSIRDFQSSWGFFKDLCRTWSDIPSGIFKSFYRICDEITVFLKKKPWRKIYLWRVAHEITWEQKKNVAILLKISLETHTGILLGIHARIFYLQGLL